MIYLRETSIQIPDSGYVEYFGSLESSKSKCFNVGAGNWFHSAWTNIDLPPQTPEFASIQKPCLFHNIASDPHLPIKSNSAHLIYTSHVIEHLPEDIVQELFISA